MSIEILTKDEFERSLHAFRVQLLHDLENLVHAPQTTKKYLRSRDVRQLLGGISTGTLMNLRVQGILRPIQLEGSKILYYDADEINVLLQRKKTWEQ